MGVLCENLNRSLQSKGKLIAVKIKFEVVDVHSEARLTSSVKVASSRDKIKENF